MLTLTIERIKKFGVFWYIILFTFFKNYNLFIRKSQPKLKTRMVDKI